MLIPRITLFSLYTALLESHEFRPADNTFKEKPDTEKPNLLENANLGQTPRYYLTRSPN